VPHPDGSYWFTDPPYGGQFYEGAPDAAGGPSNRAGRLKPRLGQPLGLGEYKRELPHGIYRVDPSGRVDLAITEQQVSNPNGLCFSLDERQLFINDTARKHIRVFDVTPTGTLTNGRLWAETKGDGPGAPDGMKIDAAGTLYCCGPGGIHVFDPEGHLREVIEAPEHTANFAWGDDDYRSLFITASTSLYRLRMETPGRPVF